MVNSGSLYRIEFQTEDIIIKIPMQRKSVRVRTSLPLVTQEMWDVKQGFQLIRAVITLKLVDADQPDSILENFDPAIQLKVRFNVDDYGVATRDGGKLRLGYWDSMTWTPFDEIEHGFRLIFDDQEDSGDWGLVNIKKWTDPTVGWGK